MSETHCDDLIGRPSAPMVLRKFLLLHRLPAAEKDVVRDALPEYIYATYKGNRVILTMASRFGDVGINHNLAATGYELRVSLDDLTDFSLTP